MGEHDDGEVPSARTQHSLAREEALERIGERLRWVREAYEAREPGFHSQAQWARALRITPEMMNRIELGRAWLAPHILQRVIYYTGVSADYVLFGVVADGYMMQWLEAALKVAHPTELRSLPRFREDRSMILRSIPQPAARTAGQGRGRYRRKDQ